MSLARQSRVNDLLPSYGYWVNVRFNMFIVFKNKYVHYYMTRDYARHRPPLVGSVLHKIALRFINQTQMLHYSRERRQRK